MTKEEIKYKIIKEYDTYYLCERPKGYKECFNKTDYKKTEDECIIKKANAYTGQAGLPPEKVNRKFNGFGTL